MSYQVLARKWRPQNFEQMVGQQHVLQGLIHALSAQRLHHAYLFTGTRGVGKTTVARILAKCFNCEKGITATPCGECQSCQEISSGRCIDLIEIDAASRTKVEDTREILDNVQYAPTHARFKIYLIDEVHMLSSHSFNALLKTLEEPPPHVKFLLATTDPQKLPVTVLSRCLQYHLKNIPVEEISKQLQHILQQENIESEPYALTLLARAANGSLRDALSLLDQAIVFGEGKVSDNTTASMLGSIEHHEVFALVEALAAADANSLMSHAHSLAEKGSDFAEVLASLCRLLNQMALTQVINTPYTQEFSAEIVTGLAKKFTPQHIQLLYQISLMGRKDLPLAPDLRTGFEMVLLRLLAFQPTLSETAAVISQVSAPTLAPAPNMAPNKPKPAATAAVSPSASLQPTGRTLTPDTWTKTLEALELNGMTKQLAQQCVLVSYQAGMVMLTVDAQHGHLVNDRIKQTLALALQNYLGATIKLSITPAQSTLQTPAKIAQAARAEQQQIAELSIQNDPIIQTLQNTFNATVKPGSARIT